MYTAKSDINIDLPINKGAIVNVWINYQQDRLAWWRYLHLLEFAVEHLVLEVGNKLFFKKMIKITWVILIFYLSKMFKLRISTKFQYYVQLFSWKLHTAVYRTVYQRFHQNKISPVKKRHNSHQILSFFCI